MFLQELIQIAPKNPQIRTVVPAPFLPPCSKAAIHDRGSFDEWSCSIAVRRRDLRRTRTFKSVAEIAQLIQQCALRESVSAQADADVAAHGADSASADAGDRPIDTSRIVQVLAKADPSPDGMLRGFRHTMLDDTDILATRHARAAVGGMLAGLTGCPAAFVSGGAEHQGGGPVAVI